jgi:small subunit ribosomal protein S2
MVEVTMRQMLDAGVHFGHQTSRWNPKMKRFIFTKRNGVYIIDIKQTVDLLNETFEKVKNIVADGGTVLFVGTKTQAQDAIVAEANRVSMPYINERWIGGLLTNHATIASRISRMKELEELEGDEEKQSKYTKKELLLLNREKDKLVKSLGGVRAMVKSPTLIWVVDTNKEKLAVDEARKLKIPVAAILDTNCDPDVVDIPVPGNDDAIRSIELLTKVIADAVAEGQRERLDRASKKVEVEAKAEATTKAEAALKSSIEQKNEAKGEIKKDEPKTETENVSPAE